MALIRALSGSSGGGVSFTDFYTVTMRVNHYDSTHVTIVITVDGVEVVNETNITSGTYDTEYDLSYDVEMGNATYTIRLYTVWATDAYYVLLGLALNNTPAEIDGIKYLYTSNNLSRTYDLSGKLYLPG